MKRHLSLLVAGLVSVGSLNAFAGTPPTATEFMAEVRSAFADAAGPGIPGGEIDLDQQAVRYLLQPIADKMGTSFDRFLDEVQGVKLKNQGKYSDITVSMNRDVTITIEDEATAKNYQLCSVHFPKQSRFRLEAIDGKIQFSPYSELVFRIKIPVISDNVYFRNITLDLATGKAAIKAGIVDNIVSVSGNAELYSEKFDGIDYGKSIMDNMALWFAAPLFFDLFL